RLLAAHFEQVRAAGELAVEVDGRGARTQADGLALVDDRATREVRGGAPVVADLQGREPPLDELLRAREPGRGRRGRVAPGQRVVSALLGRWRLFEVRLAGVAADGGDERGHAERRR